MPRRLLVVAVLFGCVGILAPTPALAQYFGQNKVQHRDLKFSVLDTEHFSIYYYPAEADAAREVARMAERWYTRLSRSLGHALSGRQPLILYASHPEFQQTNVIEGAISEGVGGVTESGRRRIVLPMAASLADTDHVIGHELVHAFQFEMLGRQANVMPLWMIEGMAEYLSIGSRDPQTAMWVRDAAYQDRLPTLEKLDDPDYFPYRFGHAFWAFVTGRWGDSAIIKIMQFVADNQTADAINAVEAVTGLDSKDFAATWHASIRQTYDIASGSTRPTDIGGVVIGPRKDRGRLDVGPALSPDGQRVAFLSERGRLSVDLYLADANDGRVIRKLVSTASDPHFDSLQFLASAGTWAPDGKRIAVATVQNGQPVIAIFEAESGDRVEEIDLPDLGEVFQPAWSPDGQTIAFVGQGGGFTDLYLYSLTSKTTRRLTSDAYGDLQPAWSPDGSQLIFVTERFSSDLPTLAIGGLKLATIAITDGRVTNLDTKQTGNATNPQWSADGRWVYFVSDDDGRPNVYRADASTGESSRLTAATTGIFGITRNSPAISVAARMDRMAVTVFRDSGYQIHVVHAPSLMTAMQPVEGDFARLPPLSRLTDLVSEQLRSPRDGLPDASSITPKEYSSRLGLASVSQQGGVSTGQFGTFASGGVSFGFTDVLGEHLLATSFGVNGGAKDIGAAISYINRKSRWNWGVIGERAPLLSGAAASGFTVIDGQTVFVQQTELFRQTVSYAGAMVAYPFSRSARVEFNSRVQHIGFDREIRTEYYDPVSGVFLGQEKQTLPTLGALRLFDVSTALVRDTSSFGVTGPVLGQRMRLEVSQMFGDLQFATVTTDLSHYIMPFQPVTFAGRVLHVGRYGASGEDGRLFPLFLGYPSLVRGYEARTFDARECSMTANGSCPEFDRLVGSRILVLNGEVRAPAFGLFKGRLEYGPLPVDLIAFYDAGLAWTSAEPSVLTGGDRRWVTSVGVGARFNLFGILIGEVDLVKALNRPNRGVTFLFAFKSGF